MPEGFLFSGAPALIEYQACHDAKTVEWLNSTHIRATFGLHRTVDEKSHRAWVDANRGTLIWAMLDAAGEHVGNVLLKISPRHRSGYFQIYIGEQRARRQGLGEMALKTTLIQAFAVHGLHRVWLHTLAGNVAAESLYAKHGFVLEGTERDALLWNGVFVSQRRWSLLEHEWRAATGTRVPG